MVMFFVHGAPMFWTYYLLTLLSIASFGIGVLCLCRPGVVLVAYRRVWDASAQFCRLPAISDEGDTKLVGVVALVLAIILAYSTFLY
jgi:hypothetical protein